MEQGLVQPNQLEDIWISIDSWKKNAAFVGQEDAILFSSGFGANAGLLRAILGKNDIAYIDSYIHTSAMSGLIGTNTKRIGHNDIEYLDMILDKEKDKYQKSEKKK